MISEVDRQWAEEAVARGQFKINPDWFKAVEEEEPIGFMRFKEDKDNKWIFAGYEHNSKYMGPRHWLRSEGKEY